MIMTKEEIKELIKTIRGSSVPGKTNDGDRIHVRYNRITGRILSPIQIDDAKRATELELPLNVYTGKLDRVYISKAGDTILTMLVELERNKRFRSFNIDKGEIKHVILIGR